MEFICICYQRDRHTCGDIACVVCNAERDNELWILKIYERLESEQVL